MKFLYKNVCVLAVGCEISSSQIATNTVSENRSAFVKGKNILDNILLAHELTHHLKTQRGGTTFKLALKLDMRKTYERIKWIFLKRVLRKLVFHHVRIKWIMRSSRSSSGRSSPIVLPRILKVHSVGGQDRYLGLSALL
ncbi:uncharacterized protein LOC126672793 [Mercurialis annua]|uniref:uncharacterized protein LOC126672793 n=1 Tax=Mercurialis annua TaxID=3986 RepID=UPI00216045DA|nr:uncharacterized protein LOC126672793 [Mercurialis annua]